ncbi:MAG: VOC family protein [Pseudomonadota bacterium]
MTYQPPNATVWSEIPVTDLDASSDFYARVTGLVLHRTDDGPNPMATFVSVQGGVAGHLYPGKPAQDGEGPTIHLAAEGTLEDVITRVWDAGGHVLSEPINIPAGRFIYCKDLDGNSIGLFERAA